MDSCESLAQSCVSCEWKISTFHPWAALYRAIYLSPDGVKLSGIHDAAFDAQGKGYSWNAVTFGPWWDLANDKPAKAHLVHSCCWNLLLRHFENEEVDLDRLFEVCMSRPAARAPQFDRYGSRPLKRPDLEPEILLGNVTGKLWHIQHSKKSVKYDRILGADCLSLLPTEIRLEIVAYLRTADFLNLRLVSRGIATIFSLQSFWRTRFRVNGDRGFLVYLTERPGKPPNWRSIYRRTATIGFSHPHLWNIRQHWRNNCWLRDRYLMTQALKDQNKSEDFQLAKVTWKKAAASIYCDKFVDWPRPRRISCKCRQYEPAPVSQTILFPDLVIALTVFILDEGTRKEGQRSHVIGMDLIRADAEFVTLGHRLPGSQVTINFDGRRLRGFRINTGGCGIRGLQPIFDSGPITSWIGDSKPGGKRFRPILKRDLKAISAKFDYCKMISLSIA